MAKVAPPDGFEETAKSGPPDGFESSAPPDGFETRSFPQRAGDFINRVLDPVAESPAVKETLSALGQRPEMQPLPLKPELGTGKTVSGPMDVVREAAGAAEQTLAAPIRAGVTLQMPQMVAQGYTTDALLKRGANKYVALAGGMIAGAIADPVNLIAGTEIAGALAQGSKARQALKMEMLTKDAQNSSLNRAFDEFGKETYDWQGNQIHADAIHADKMRTLDSRQAEIDALPPATGKSTPTQFKQIAIPEGEPKDVLLRTQTGPTIPQYKQKMTDVQSPGAGKLIGMHETQPVAGKVEFQNATLLPKETKLLVPENYEPARPGTREIPKGYVPAPEIIPVEGYRPWTPLAEPPVSEATSHMEMPISTFLAPKEPPTRFDTWANSAIKELDDLASSRDLATPSEVPHDDFSKTFRRYVGHQELARFDAIKMTDEFAAAVPDRSRRTLLTLYSQLGRAPTIEELNSIRTNLAKVKSPYAKSLSETADELMGHNLSLTPEESVALSSYNRYFQGIGENAQKVGILGQMRDIYGGPHVYEPKADAEMGFFRKLVTGKSRFAQPRSFDNSVQAIEAGYVPKTLDAAELLSIYHNNTARAASERYLMDALEKQGLINYEGRGRQIKGFQSGSVKIKDQIYKKIPYSDNTEIQKVMARAAEDPVLDYPIIHAIEKANNLQKIGSLYLQVFHPKALAMEAMGKGFSPRKFQAGLDLVDQNPEYVRGMIRAGLTVNTMADVGKQLSANAVRDYKGIHPVQTIRKINDIYTGWVFGKYMTGLKVWNANVLAKRFIDMGVTPERSMELAVADSNTTFGQLNLKLMSRSPNMQRIFSMLSFAPDWTESRLRQMAGVAGRGFGEVSDRERQLLTLESWKYWSRTTAIAATTHLAAQLNPYDKILSVDMSAESGFKDVTKVAKLLALNPVYFRSKLAAVPRTMVDFMDPRLSTERKFESLVTSPLPITIQNVIRNLEKESTQ